MVDVAHLRISIVSSLQEGLPLPRTVGSFSAPDEHADEKDIMSELLLDQEFASQMQTLVPTGHSWWVYPVDTFCGLIHTLCLADDETMIQSQLDFLKGLSPVCSTDLLVEVPYPGDPGDEV